MAPPFNTPKKARIKGSLQFLETLKDAGIKVPKARQLIAQTFDCDLSTVSHLKNDHMDRTKPHEEGERETRGRKRKISNAECARIEKLYDDHPDEAPDMPWRTQLAEACEMDADVKTIRRAMKEYGGYGKYVAVVRPYVPPKRAELRVAFCKERLEMWDQADFLRIRYSDESHFGWKQKPMGRQYISRKKGERYLPRNHRQKPEEENPHDRHAHVWGCVGLDFKSSLVQYSSASPNGKLTQRVYLDEILKPNVGAWLEAGDVDWVLEEDNDSGHGPSSRNIVRTWKEEVGLEYFFNAPHSPDLSPVENCWVPCNDAVNKSARLVTTTSDLFEMAEGAWNDLDQESINSWIRSARQRYKDCVALGGQTVVRERLARDKNGVEIEPSDGDSDAEGEEEDLEDQDQFER